MFIEEYETSKWGKRHVPVTKAVGEGRCCILKHAKGKQIYTQLVYKLELPRADKSDSPQAQLNIEEESLFIIQVKNSIVFARRNAGLDNKKESNKPCTSAEHH